MKKLLALLLACSSWLALGPIFKPVQFIMNFLPQIKNEEKHYNIVLAIGVAIISILYFFWLGLIKWSSRKQ